MNQGTLDGVKQEMARFNTDILRICQLKWMRMGKFNLDGHYIYYCGQEFLRRIGVALMIKKSPKCSTWVQPQKWKNDLGPLPRQPFNITGIQLYVPNTNDKEAKVEWFCEDLQDLLELTHTHTHTNVPFISRKLECKSRKSRDTWSNKQLWPWRTKWSRAKDNRILPKENNVIENNLLQQHKRWLYMWTSPDSEYQNQINYVLCRPRWRSCIQLVEIRPRADCGSDHEFLIGKFRFKLKKVGKTTRPFRYDLNQIPYDYTV